MCGRFTIVSPTNRIVSQFEVDEVDDSVGESGPDWNVSPRRMVLAVRDHDDRRVLSRLRWGLVPGWAKDVAIGDRLINARAETLAEKPSFRRAFARKRCLIPADGFYEWAAVPVAGAKPRKQPFYVHRRDDAPLALAGLWETWKVPEGTSLPTPDGWLRTCTIVTTDANAVLAPVHHRMPVVLERAAWDEWLDPDVDDVGALARLLRPAADDRLVLHAVSTKVNGSRANGPDLIEPIEPIEPVEPVDAGDAGDAPADGT